MSKENDIKAQAVMDFVNMMIGAFESGFVDKHNPTLSEIYQVARNHVRDNYDFDASNIVAAWGSETAKQCGLSNMSALGITPIKSES